MNFYSWCLQHDRQDILNMWIDEADANNVPCYSHKKYKIKCPKCGKETDLSLSSVVNNPRFQFKCSYCNSFGVWCEQNNSKWLQYWDYDKNKVSPYEVSKTNGLKAFFKCSRGLHESEPTRISDITSYKRVPYHCDRCNSFEQWCIDNGHQDLLNRWDYELNKITPDLVSFGSNKKYYFKCPIGKHASEQKLLTNVLKQEGSRACLACNSFATKQIELLGEDLFNKYWSDKNTLDPYQVTPKSAKKAWFNCLENDSHPPYQAYILDFSAGSRCPYCSHHKVISTESVGAKYPSIIDVWSEKNKKDCFEVSPQSNKKYLFNCSIHGEYEAQLCTAIKRTIWCPMCNNVPNSSNLQRRVAEYIQAQYHYTLMHEQSCSLYPINPKTNCHLPYDNEIVELKMIIEVMGRQHYEPNMFTELTARHYGKSIEEAFAYEQWKDEFKKQYVLDHGYYYLAIPYWTEKAEEYKKLIDDAISIRKKDLCISP